MAAVVAGSTGAAGIAESATVGVVWSPGTINVSAAVVFIAFKVSRPGTLRSHHLIQMSLFFEQEDYFSLR